MNKKFIAALLTSAALAVNAAAVDLYVDTVKIATDTPPTVVSGRTLVPVRPIFESLGATVSWDQDTKIATGVKGDTTVIIQINNSTAYVNGEPKALDVPAQLINERTMVPARFVAEALNCDVTWYQEAQTAAVAYELKGQHIYVTETGERYHFDGSCNGGKYYEATLAEAMGRGLTPCVKCIGDLVPASPVPEDTTQPATSDPTVPAAPSVPATPSPSVTPVVPSTPAAPSSPAPTAPSTNTTSTPTVPQTSPSNSSHSTVYITRTGKRYHYNPNCGKGKYFEATLQEALSRGLTPCNKCVN